jgi:nucleotide sugar dehydrogenase
MNRQRVTVIGSGYVGTVAAACFASTGSDVVGLEIDRSKLASLQRGRAPFFERGLDVRLERELASGHLRFTDDVADAVRSSDFVFFCVGTPAGDDGHADVEALTHAARAVARGMDGPKVLVTKSTVPIGTGHWLESVVDDALPAARRDTSAFSVVANPEFLRQGSALDDFLHPDRLVLGSDEPAALERVVDLYRPILEQSFEGGRRDQLPELVRTNLTSAETLKYASNAFLALKVSFVNEIANICELTGGDITLVAEGLGLDRRIGRRFLDAGVGWGGSCFGKDVGELIAVAADHGYDAKLLRAAREVNDWQRLLVVKKLRRRLRGLRGRRIGLLGLAFKPGTDDLRDAPAVDIAATLVGGGATVVGHDPVVRDVPDVPALSLVDDPYDVAGRADAVVLLTEWPEYLELELDSLRDRMRGDLFIDGRNVFDPAKVEAVGLAYEGIGRSPVADVTIDSPLVDASTGST